MGLKLDDLEAHLTTRSYIEGYTPSQADALIYNSLTDLDSLKAKYPHSTRWYSQIDSYKEVLADLPGTSTAGQAFLQSASAPAPSAPDDDDEFDLFAEEEEDPAKEQLKAEAAAAYHAKKANKPKISAKSVVTLDVKPHDDETDMEALEQAIRSIQWEGLLWGGSKLVPVGYGIKKLQINLVVEDELVSIDALQEEIMNQFEELYVQSTDVAAMQKL